MIEVILDTNVLVAAFRSSLGASYRLLQTPIVTFNGRDFKGADSLGIRTMTPGQLLRMLGESAR